jgi:hypothetical protein
VVNFCHIATIFLKKEYSVKIPDFLLITFSKDFATMQPNCLQYEKGASDFPLSYFEYHQIRLNTFIDAHHHYSNITKLKKQFPSSNIQTNNNSNKKCSTKLQKY